MRIKLIIATLTIILISVSVYSYTNLKASTKSSDFDNSISTTTDNKQKTVIDKTQTINEISVIGDYALPTDLKEFEEWVDIILIGSPTMPFLERKHEATYSSDGSLEDFFTRTEIEIEKVLKNNSDIKLKKDELFNIVEPSVGLIKESNNESTKITTGPYNELEKDSVYLIFLKKNSNNDYAIALNVLGKYNIDDTDKKDTDVERYHYEYESWKDLKQDYKKSLKKKYGF
ncbi:hypothetical protein [Sporosarcina sp. A2]|uniref:hypothetical protein n=1 Tax=Sporosarcina sp. A2 TaxID=3393449 RepID=UPI003D7A41DD